MASISASDFYVIDRNDENITYEVSRIEILPGYTDQVAKVSVVTGQNSSIAGKLALRAGSIRDQSGNYFSAKTFGVFPIGNY